MNKSLLNLLLAGALICPATALRAEPSNAQSGAAGTSLRNADPAAVARWKAMRFGMFIHWGPVSLTAKEIGWSRGAVTPVEVYDNLYKQFNPTNFNASQWVSLAKAAGMKYIVLTAKHMDGFCLWDTKQTDYNIMNSPFHRDVVKELAAACKKQGVAFGTYYCVGDVHHPDYPITSPGPDVGTKHNPLVRRAKFDLDSYNRYLLAQISELITNYGPLLTIWNDAPWEFESARGANTIKLARSLQPDILINNRTGARGDYDTPEQVIGSFQMDRPWESCMTISKSGQWAWGGAQDGVKPLAACLEMIIRAAGGDGNVLLNIGPRPDGLIDPEQAGRLKEIGVWLARNGQSIYGTRGGPWKPNQSVVSTRKGNIVFLHILRWKDDSIELPDIARKIKSASLLNGGEVKVEQQDGKVTVIVPASERDGDDTVVKLKLDGSAMELPALAVLPKARAAASNVFQNNVADYGPQNAFDGDDLTRWATDGGTKKAWIAASFEKNQTIYGVRVEEAFAGRVQKFEFQYREGDDWKTVFSGTTLGEKFEKSFEPVMAREFRLNILDATDGPTINEIEFLKKWRRAEHP